MFFEFRELLFWFLCVTAFALGIFGVYVVKGRDAPIRVPVRIGSIALTSIGLLALCLGGCGKLLSVASASAPIYSPDRKRALRVETHDEGATGGGTEVYLYSNLGLRRERITEAGFKQVEPRNVAWLKNNEVLIRYLATYQPPVCSSTRDVAVRCEKNQ
jgi:hypothetical protein